MADVAQPALGSFFFVHVPFAGDVACDARVAVFDVGGAVAALGIRLWVSAEHSSMVGSKFREGTLHPYFAFFSFACYTCHDSDVAFRERDGRRH